MGIERVIGLRIRNARRNIQLSQMELAERVGVSYQQIQKYEKGITRISLFRLEQIAVAMGLPLVALLTGNDEVSVPATGEPETGYRHLSSPSPLNREETRLLLLFRRLPNSRLRAGVLQQLKGLVELGERKHDLGNK